MAKKMTLHELQAEQEKAERELKIAKQNLRILKSDEKEADPQRAHSSSLQPWRIIREVSSAGQVHR